MDQEMNQQIDQQADNGGVLAVCPRKKNDKKPVVFYADRMTFNNETILYRDIDSVSTYGSEMTYNVIFTSYSSYVTFKLNDGRKLKWKNSMFGMFGLGSLKTKKACYSAMIEATLATVAKTIAARYITQVRQGATIKIGPVTIDPNGITGKHFAKTQTTPFSDISGADYSACQVHIHRASVQKTAVNSVSSQVDNGICLIYIINSLATGTPGAQAGAPEDEAPANEE